MKTQWRRIWRQGLAPLLSREELIALEIALENDDRRLIQGSTVHPLLLDAWAHRAIQGACALGFCGWRGAGLRTLAEVEAYFHRLCDAADAVLKEPGACRYFLTWYDDTPRGEMRRALLAEVRWALSLPLAA